MCATYGKKWPQIPGVSGKLARREGGVGSVIGIRDLQPFLAAHEVPFVPEISNASKNNHYRITDEAWRTELRTIYARDYAIDVLDLHDAIARTLSQEG